MPMGGHGRQLSPDVRGRVIALNRVQGLEAIPSSDNMQLPIQNSHSKLQPPARHSSHGVPCICS